MPKINGKDNILLVEFDFVIDIDLGLYKYFTDKLSNIEGINKEILSIDNDIIRELVLLNRYRPNPLDLFIDSSDNDKLYNMLINTEDIYKDILYNYANAYDTFGLMVTFLKEASSVDLDILCRNKIEEDFIESLNPMVPTIVCENKKNINLSNYTALYIKFFKNARDYAPILGKHIYIPTAKYSMDENENRVNTELVVEFGDVNIIHLIDLYKDIKYRYPKKNERKELSNE